MVPIDGAWVVSYSTSVEPTIVSVTVFKYLILNFHDLELGGFNVTRVKVYSVNRKPIVGFISDII